MGILDEVTGKLGELKDKVVGGADELLNKFKK